MNNKINTKELAVWIAGIKEAAKTDAEEQVFWYVPTMNKPLSIVAGWTKMFDKDYSDIFCCSKSEPGYVMCIKVAVNTEQLCLDFDSFNMPTDKFGNVEDTCIPLEWDDMPEAAAEFFAHEWERLMEA